MSGITNKGSSLTSTLGDDPRRERPERFLPDGKRAEARRLFEEGCGYRLAAKKLRLSINTVRYWKHQFDKGTFRDRIEQKQYVYNEDARRQAIEMREAGATWREIFATTGIHSSSVRSWMRAAKDQS